MGGFIKGVAVGLASFVLGFVVLSVALPVDPDATPQEAPVVTDLAPATAIVPDGALVPATPEAAPATPAPSAAANSAPPPGAPLLPSESGAEAPAALAALAPAQGDAVVVTPPPSGPPGERAPDVAALAPVAPPSPPEIPAMPASADDVAPVTLTGPPTIASATPPVPAGTVDTPTERSADLAALPAVATPPAPANPALPAAGPDNATALTGPTAIADAATPSSVPIPDTPSERSESLAALPPVAAPPAPAEPALPASGTDSAGAMPDIAPVAAPATPVGEPLLATVEPEPPPVSTLPTNVAGVVVSRGVLGDASVVRRGGGTTVGRLPTIGETAAASPEPTPQAPSGPALARFAATPAMTADQQPLGVVLIDDPAAETAILALPVPVTIAMDPYDPDAPRRAEAYRLAGHEIALRALNLPGLATDSDLATIVDAWQRAFPEAVAVIDVPLNGLGANPTLARNFAAMLAPAGYGVISLRDGLDAFLQAARSDGMHAASVYRMIEGSEQSGITIRRLIDRAAFEALRQPSVLIAASATDRDTMRELADFASGNGRAGVALTPASTVLNRN